MSLDTQTNLHAVALLALLVGGLAALVLLPRRRPTNLQSLAALLVGSLVTLFLASCHHMCDEGQSVRQWQLPAPLLFAVLLWTKPARWRRGVAAILALGMAVLHYHFVELVHEHGWTGNPNQQRWAAIDRRMVSEAVRRAAYDTDASDTPISAGPLRETPMWELMKQQVRRGSPNRREIGRAWHTWLTGLYPYRVIPQEYWYPGGPPETAAEHIEARDIEEPAATMPKP